ncbi:MAG: FAD-dependent oxidoreductase [Planctomycetes bacterium]|nr:FAD-dependent oxidoreductase [Planctomycetota bacterium]
MTESSDVLVLGGGFAGVEVARRLERLLPRTASITLVSAENYLVFQPLLPEVVGGNLDPGHVVAPLRHLVRRAHVVRGEVVGIDLARREVEVSTPGNEPGAEQRSRFAGRHLVLALGSVVDVSRTPGMSEHALLMKNLADALALRAALVARLERAVVESDPVERAALLTFVVVGGGFSGIETAAEMWDMLRHAQRFYPSLRGERMRVLVVDGNASILRELHPDLGAFARRLLERRGVELLLETRTRAVSAEAVHLDDGSTLATRTVVCTVGNAPHPVLQDLPLRLERGRVATDAFLRVPGHADVWALGDGAWVPDGHGGIAPPTAQFATRMGRRVAENIAAALRGAPPAPFRHRSQGQMATLGRLNAVAYVRGLKFSGFLAWWLWRTIYLLKLPGLDRKLRVVTDWTLRLFFPRELTFVDPKPTRGLARIHLEKGEVLFRQGDVSATFYVVESGRMQLSQQDEAGQVTLCEELTAGAHFGQGSLLRNRVRRTTAVALEPSTVLAFPARDFDQLTQRFTALRRLLEGSANRFLPRGEILPRGVPRELMERPVREVMVSPVVSLPDSATLRDALELMSREPFHCLPLVDAAGRLVSVATRNDVYGALLGSVDLARPLLQDCAEVVRCVTPAEPVERVIELMRRHDVQYVPVVDDSRRLVGIVSVRDVVRRYLQAVPALARR